MTSGVLTDTERTEPDERERVTAVRPDRPIVHSVVRKRLARPPRPNATFWLAAMLTTMIGFALRMVNLAHPPDKIFDELYYAEEANDLLQHGVEWNPSDNTPQYVVHPPLGKWMIAVGEQLFGYTSFGWRISAVVIGSLSILITIIIAQRLFRSTVLACAAGLLMTLDGLHFVLSRVALLDIFLMFFVVVAFACIVLDREQRRARWLAALESGLDPSAPGRASRPRLGVPWWRLAAGVSLGLGLGVKWSAIYFVLGFALLALLWEMGTRRSAGARRPIVDTLLDESLWVAAFIGLAVLAYLATWTGWFVSDDGYFRNWQVDVNGPSGGGPVLDALLSLAHYHDEAYKFHSTLSTEHRYQSWPWQWLLLGRPVAFYWNPAGPCGAENCASEILLLGTPLLWWSFLPALVALTWLGIARRDWRAWAIGFTAILGIVPWFWNQLNDRTMFYFYALPSEPFLVLAVVYVLGAIIGPSKFAKPHSDQRLFGAIIAGAYMLLVAACFAYFYPIYTGEVMAYQDWLARMWLGGRWI